MVALVMVERFALDGLLWDGDGVARLVIFVMNFKPGTWTERADAADEKEVRY